MAAREFTLNLYADSHLKFNGGFFNRGGGLFIRCSPAVRSPKPRIHNVASSGLRPGLATGAARGLARLAGLTRVLRVPNGFWLWAGKPAVRKDSRAAPFQAPEESLRSHALPPHSKTRSPGSEVKWTALIILGKIFRRADDAQQGAARSVVNHVAFHF